MCFEKLSSGRFVAAVCAVSLTVAVSSGRAATLSSVPMQGGMVMPMVSYHSSDGTMRMMMPETVPQLTPLLVSNPGDSFDPADPWFSALDPSAQGNAFSRRYGFKMDASTDLLPAGTQIWIRKLSGSAVLIETSLPWSSRVVSYRSLVRPESLLSSSRTTADSSLKPLGGDPALLRF